MATKKAVKVEQEVPAETSEEQVEVEVRSRDLYCLLINDSVQMGTGLPVGNWYAYYINFKSTEAYGPYPLLATTRTGQAPFSGYVAMDSLRAAAEFLWKRLYNKQEDMDQETSLNLVSGSNKMMSCWLTSIPD